MKRRGFLKSLAALPLLGFLKPSISEDEMDAAAARAALADPARFSESEVLTECTCQTFNGTFTYTIHHSDGSVESFDGPASYVVRSGLA